MNIFDCVFKTASTRTKQVYITATIIACILAFIALAVFAPTIFNAIVITIGCILATWYTVALIWTIVGDLIE